MPSRWTRSAFPAAEERTESISVSPSHAELAIESKAKSQYCKFRVCSLEFEGKFQFCVGPSDHRSHTESACGTSRDPCRCGLLRPNCDPGSLAPPQLAGPPRSWETLGKPLCSREL